MKIQADRQRQRCKEQFCYLLNYVVFEVLMILKEEKVTSSMQH
jgi:hypothetical protein